MSYTKSPANIVVVRSTRNGMSCEAYQGLREVVEAILAGYTRTPDAPSWEAEVENHIAWLESLRPRIDAAIARCRKDIEDDRQVEAELARQDREDGASSPAVTVQPCPDCAPKPDEVNHPKGMIFVGWGVGWKTCSTCGGSGEVTT